MNKKYLMYLVLLILALNFIGVKAEAQTTSLHTRMMNILKENQKLIKENNEMLKKINEILQIENR